MCSIKKRKTNTLNKLKVVFASAILDVQLEFSTLKRLMVVARY